MSDPNGPEREPAPGAGHLPGAPTRGGADAGAPPAAANSTGLADGEWHRLHPASPLLRGGLVFIAIAGFVIANLRERLVEFFFGVFGAPSPVPTPGEEYAEWEQEWANDPVGAIFAQNLVGWALLAVLVVVLAVIGGYALAWRMHSFRVTDEAVEVRSGILFRSHRSARLDRIQGVNINRPLFARLFGASKLEVAVAGESANVQLSYLGASLADGLRRDILRLASGARAARSGTAAAAPTSAAADAPPSVATPAPATGEAPGALAPGAVAAGAGAPADAPEHGGRAATARDFVSARVDDFLAPELDPDLAPPESVVHLPLGRVIGSTALSGASIWILVIVGVLVWGGVSGTPWVFISFVPAAIGIVSYAWSRITRSLRYTIAGTADGVRIGHGLLSTANQTIPPGRVHAVQVSQWVFWRPFGWWTIRVNLAGVAMTSGDQSQRTTVLPVGTVADVHRVLALLVPGTSLDGLVDAGLAGRGADGYSETPRRAAWLRPFSWRRIGWAVEDGAVLFRRGALVRSLTLVPLARMQSVAVSRGPVDRMLRLAGIRVHTVAGPITAELPVGDETEAEALFERLAADAVASAGAEEAAR